MNVHLIGQHLTPELATWASSLRRHTKIYTFATSSELLAAWQLARSNANYDAITPTSVIWLQTRPGQYSQAEIDAVLIADPLARPVIIAGALCAGEPRSGKLLLDVTRFYWHQPLSAFWNVIRTVGPDDQPAGQWIAIHAAQLTDYEGLAGLCRSLGHSTIWQNDRWPIISSEPDYRMFRGWIAWERWCENRAATPGSASATPAILVLDFPTPGDVERANEIGIDHVLAAPFRSGDLRTCLYRRRVQSALERQVSRPSTQTPRVYGRAG